MEKANRTNNSKGNRALVLTGVIPALVGAMVGVVFGGLKVAPPPYPSIKAPHAQTEQEIKELPHNLPAPIERFYKLTYGEQIPVIRTAALSGRGTMRLYGITFPLRFRFNYEAGQGFRSHFELTLFGKPILKANEYFLKGK